MDPEGEGQIRQLLDDLGDPETIRAEAGFPPISRAARGNSWAGWLLLLGGFGFIVGSMAGMVLLWHSSL